MGSYDKSEQLPVSRDKLSRLRWEPIRPLKSKLVTYETNMVQNTNENENLSMCVPCDL